MYIPTPWLLLLPTLASAQDQQVPFMAKLKGMVDQAQSAFQKVTSKPTEAASAKIASHSVHPLTFDNWQTVLQHSGKVRPYNPPEAWLVYFTGGNKTCHGRCEQADLAWNTSVPFFLDDISAPKLAAADCDDQELLCGAWGVSIPSLWMILRPQPLADQSPGATTITIHKLNTTTVDDSVITNIHTRREYLGVPRYEGLLHPFDGWIARLGLMTPMALGLFWLSKVPNWAFMIGISLFSRYFVNRRMPAAAPAADRPAGGQSAPSGQ